MGEKSFYKNIYFILLVKFIGSGIGLGVYCFLNNQKAALYMGFGTLLYFILPLILKKKKIELPYKLWSFIVVYLILGYDIGFVMDGFKKFMHFDKLVHFISGFLYSIIGLTIFLYMHRKNRTRWSLAILFSFFFSMFVALACEFSECTIFLTTGYDSQNTLTTGVLDTMGDLTASLISSVIISIYYYIVGKRNRLNSNSIISKFCKMNSCKL